MTESDISLIKQMMSAGRFEAVYDYLPDYNLMKSKQIIESMGSKWCCHPDNAVKKLDQPLPILSESRVKILRRK
jgi:hypothetical protein